MIINFVLKRACFTGDVVLVGETVGINDAWLLLVPFGTGGVGSGGAEHLPRPRPHRVHVTRLHKEQNPCHLLGNVLHTLVKNVH